MDIFVQDYDMAEPSRPRRRGSLEVPVIPAHQQPPLTLAVQRWIAAIEQFDDTFRRPLAYYAQPGLMNIPDGTIQRVWAGDTTKPRERHCRNMQAFFASYVARGMIPPADTPRLDLEEVMGDIAGYSARAEYAQLRHFAALSHSEFQREMAVTATPEWEASALPEKEGADQAVKGSAPPEMRIYKVAAWVQRWLGNPQCPLPVAERERLLNSHAAVDTTHAGDTNTMRPTGQSHPDSTRLTNG